MSKFTVKVELQGYEVKLQGLKFSLEGTKEDAPKIAQQIEAAERNDSSSHGDRSHIAGTWEWKSPPTRN